MKCYSLAENLLRPVLRVAIRRSPRRWAGTALDHPPARREPRLRGPVCSSPGKMNKCSRASEKSNSWGLNGVRYLLRHEAVREMKAGPSESPYRGRLQTAMSGLGQKPRS